MVTDVIFETFYLFSFSSALKLFVLFEASTTRNQNLKDKHTNKQTDKETNIYFLHYLRLDKTISRIVVTEKTFLRNA